MCSTGILTGQGQGNRRAPCNLHFRLEVPYSFVIGSPKSSQNSLHSRLWGKINRGCKACLANEKKLFAESWDLLFQIP